LDGFLKPISSVKTFEADAVLEAFRYMQQGLRMGKIIISMRDAQGNIKTDTNTVAQTKAAPSLDPSGSYLLVGGLGGLGRAVSRWMVEQGARRLVYLSRSAGAYTLDQQSFIKEIQSMGCEVRLIQGSVTSTSDVRKAVAASPNLKGILQMSMVLRDQAWDRMSLQEWTEAADPKVKGTWNPHEATAKINTLDFLVMFSSTSGTIGQPGQADYVGVNTFLDAFALYRASLRLPATSIDVGAIDDIGVVSNNENLRRAMKSTCAYMIKEVELLEALGAAIKMSKPPSWRATTLCWAWRRCRSTAPTTARCGRRTRA
jgi:NAD(P)-dependent dehydrogenase (short-subunit alcohol dehydrogenase family)